MLFSKNYRQPFWHGFFHAMLIILYVLFLAVFARQLEFLYNNEIEVLIRYTFGIFRGVLSVGVCGWLLFYEPLKRLFHHQFKAATVMLLSTLGWLFIFMLIFIFGLVFSM